MLASEPISELQELDLVTDLVQEYERTHGSKPFNLSHWDPCTPASQAILDCLRLPAQGPPLDYLYSYHLDASRQVAERLGFRGNEAECLLTPAGTHAMLFAVWWLKAIGVSRLIVVCPAYFPVFYQCNLLGLEYRRTYSWRDSGSWYLPSDEIATLVRKRDTRTAIWITSPVYCTGIYVGDEDLAFLRSLLRSGVAVVLDECLAAPGREIGPALGDEERLLAVYSPHKSICVNAVKFSALVFHRRYRRFFNEWTDVLTGGLSSCNLTAVGHFLSSNFPDVRQVLFHFVDRARRQVESMIDGVPTLEFDRNPLGHFVTCYASSLGADLGSDRSFLRDFLSQTGALVIPGLRNHFSPSAGLSFRINLARASPQFYGAFGRTVNYLNHQSDAPEVLAQSL